MTLPRGFGEGWDYERPERKCKLGKICYHGGYGDRCKTHQWIYDHEGAYIGIVLTSIFVTALLIIILVSYLHDLSLQPARDIINGYNCGQLAEYIASKFPVYEYAEHRYEWLCVNEQIKEFQG